MIERVEITREIIRIVANHSRREVLSGIANDSGIIRKSLDESEFLRIQHLSPVSPKGRSSLSLGEGEGRGGKFLFEGHHFELRRAETFDFAGKPQKYTMPEGVAFRQKTAEQTVLKAKSAAITKALKAIKDAFPTTHPNIEPDSVEFTVVCVD